MSKTKKIFAKKIAKNIFKLLLVSGVFFLGVNFGNGRINLSSVSFFPRNSHKNLPAHLNYQSIDEIYNNLKVKYDGDLDETKLLDGLKEGIAKSAGDPYTEYLNKEATKEFNNQLSGSFEGIGAELSKDGANIVVVSPISGFPADKAGLKSKDIIAEINDQNSSDISVSQAVKRIRGPKGTTVKLTIVRKSEVLHLEIIRDKISIPSVKSEILNGNIGYLRISIFGEDTVPLAQEAAQKFKTASVKGVILDLRGNPGGLLEDAVDVSSLWLDSKLILQEKRGSEVVNSFMSRGKPVLSKIPTVVLIDEGSASASEITAGALKDNDVAKLVGVKSFGKGSVQQLLNLSGGGVLKVTVARWYTPKGRNIDKQGIEPDQEVKLSVEEIKAGKDLQKQAAIDYLLK